jgi:predicted DNA-binding transcriptional regulator AlpA
MDDRRTTPEQTRRLQGDREAAVNVAEPAGHVDELGRAAPGGNLAAPDPPADGSPADLSAGRVPGGGTDLTTALAPALERLVEGLLSRLDGPRAAEPALVSAKVAARLCGISRASWERLHAAGKIPAPVRLGTRVLWRVEELRRFIQAGCPPGWRAVEAARRRPGT